MSAITVVRASGNPEERGRSIGEGFRSQIERAGEFYRTWTSELGLDEARIDGLLAPYIVASERHAPRTAALLRATAAGAGVPERDVWVANAFEDLYQVLAIEADTPPDRCTAFAVVTDEVTLLAHQEQWYAGEADAIGLLIDVPDDAPPLIAPVVGSCVPLVGMNLAGAALALMSLACDDVRPGVPRALVAREALGSRSRSDAVAAATMPHRAGGYTWLWAFDDGQTVLLETTATRAAVLEGRTHTNHALDPGIAELCDAPSPGSRSRFDRLEGVSRERPPTVAGAMDVLRDHGAAGMDICVHAVPADGAWSTCVMFGMVCDLRERVLWLAPGNPCEHAFEPFRLDELVG